jgi:two-component system chemotaxis response regulator CheB
MDREDGCDLVVIGASAGGVAALIELVQRLPVTLDAAIVVVLHLPSGGRSELASILRRSGPLPVSTASDGAPVALGHVYVAPPDHHTLVEDGRLRLVVGPKENGHRPSIDPLFRSAAASRGPHVIGVVLSGMLDDGTAGLREVKRCGGVAIVQDPAEALYGGMAESAIANVQVDEVARLATIAELLTSLTSAGSGDAPAVGSQTGLACPACGGAVREVRDGPLLRLRCHAGHGYTLDGFLAAQASTVEAKVLRAIQALREKAASSRRMARRLSERDLDAAAEHMGRVADQSESYASLLEQSLRVGVLGPGIDEG